MALYVHAPFPLCGMGNLNLQRLSSSSSRLGGSNSGELMVWGRNVKVKASCFSDPTNQPILKEVIKEPVAFMGGLFAGLLRLDLDEEPLKEWVTRTVEASGITTEDIDTEGSKLDEVPQQIEIE